ncbi:MAG: sugar transferase [Gemmatimonadota bacterium]
MLNVGVALVGLVLASPLMAVIALAVKTTSSGPILRRQPHVGLDRRRSRRPGPHGRRSLDRGGRIFDACTFRVTRWGTVQDQAPPPAGEGPLTAVGSILRACGLERLPLLFNVLRGDMNVVGPRPERPDLFRDLREELGASYGRYAERQTVLPGITGLAQVSGAWNGYPARQDGIGPELDLDLEYVRRRTAARDLSILASLIPVMLLRRIRE